MNLFSLLLCLSLSISAAELTWLRPDRVNLQKIASPPLPESAADKEDIATIIKWQNLRTEDDCRQASQEAEALATSFFGPPSGPLTEEEARGLLAFQEKLFSEVRVFIRTLKERYDRPRPHLRNSAIEPCVPLERSKAYPSGHATIATVAARTFSLLYPEREVAFLVRADQIGFNRVVGGVHHPSDVLAGKFLGNLLYLALIQEESFRRDVEALKP